MAKKKGTAAGQLSLFGSSPTQQLNNQLVDIERKITALYGSTYKYAAQLAQVRAAVNGGKEFSFADNPAAAKAIETRLNAVAASLDQQLSKATTRSFALGQASTEHALGKALGTDKATKTEVEAICADAAAEMRRRGADGHTFYTQKRGGVSISDRVWLITESTKLEIEIAIQQAALEGRSADELAQTIQQYLQHPERLFRSVRIKDPITGQWTGEYRMSKAAQQCHPGQGVYRSAYRNALRLARTELTQAYRRAEWETYQDNPLITGYTIELSNNHTTTVRTKKGKEIKPLHDICDEMAGTRYPKSFLWTGWHPQCRCRMMPIIISKDDFKERIKARHRGKLDEWHPKEQTTEMPKSFTDWVEANQHRWQQKGKAAPFFIRDNYQQGDSTKGLDPRITAELEAARFIAEQAAQAITEEGKAMSAQQIDKLIKEAEKRGQESIDLGKILGFKIDEEICVSVDYLAKQTWYKESTEEIPLTNLRSVQDEVYTNVLIAHQNGKGFEASSEEEIRVAEIGGIYYIVDGNHRAVVAMANGKTKIKAIVVHIPVKDLADLTRIAEDDIDRWVDIIQGGEQYKPSPQPITDYDNEVQVLRSVAAFYELDLTKMEQLRTEGNDKDALRKEIDAQQSVVNKKQRKWESEFRKARKAVAALKKVADEMKKEFGDTGGLADDTMLADLTRNINAEHRTSDYQGSLYRLQDYTTKANDIAKALQAEIDKRHKAQQQQKQKQNGALNPEYQGEATGKDLSNKVDCNTIPTSDTYQKDKRWTYEIAKMQGFDAPAKLVSEKEFSDLANKHGDVFYRTVNGTYFNNKIMDSAEFASQLFKAKNMTMNGTGWRLHGDGIYVASSAWTGTSKRRFVTPLNKSEAYSESRAYGDSSATIYEMTWTRTPKMIEATTLKDMWNKLTPAEQKKYGNHENTYACTLGYDAIYCDGAPYIVILNRSIIAINKKYV